MRKKFKRSTQSIVAVIIFAILLFYLIIIIIGCAEEKLFGYTLTPTGSVLLMVLYFFFGLVTLLIVALLPPDFEYVIRRSNDWVIFEISEEDHRKIDRNFSIVSQKRGYIVLDDGLSRIRIGYNKEVLQFLNEINN